MHLNLYLLRSFCRLWTEGGWVPYLDKSKGNRGCPSGAIKKVIWKKKWIRPGRNL